MLSRNRNSAVELVAPLPLDGFEHISRQALGTLRWLDGERVDFVVVGALAGAIRGGAGVADTVAIVPAPYGRNVDRLLTALRSIGASRRAPATANATGGGRGGMSGVVRPASGAAARLDAIDLVGPVRLALRCGEYEIDIEGRPVGAPSYQDLLFDAHRFELAAGLAPEVASAEHIELYAQLRLRAVGGDAAAAIVARRTGAAVNAGH